MEELTLHIPLAADVPVRLSVMPGGNLRIAAIYALARAGFRIECLSPTQLDGPIAVWGEDFKGAEYLVGRELAPGVWEHD